MEISTVLFGLLIPFIGTSAGAACVFFLRKDLKLSVQRMLNGFAAGVMVAASIWSLIVPAIEQSASKGCLAFLPAFLGFWIGIAFMLLDHVIPHLHRAGNQTEGPKSHLARITMMVLAVTRLRDDQCGRGAGPDSRHRDPELPGGRDHLHAAVCRG